MKKDYYVHTSTVAKYSKKVMIQWINNEINYVSALQNKNTFCTNFDVHRVYLI